MFIMKNSSWFSSTIVFSMVEYGLSSMFLSSRHPSSSVGDEIPTCRQFPQSHNGIFAT